MENEKTKISERNIENYIQIENERLFLKRIGFTKTVEERRFEISLAMGHVSRHPTHGCMIEPEQVGYEKPYVMDPAKVLEKPKLVTHPVIEY